MKGKQSVEKVNSKIDIYDGVYDEYNNDHERYLQTHQEFSLKKAKSNTKIEPLKVTKRKCSVIGAAICGMVVGALVVGLPLYYTKCPDLTNSTIVNAISISSQSATMPSMPTTISTSSTTMSSASNESSTSISGTLKII